MKHLDERQSALLDGLRQAHRAERASSALSRRVVARLDSRYRGGLEAWSASLRLRKPSAVFVVYVAALSIAALGLLWQLREERAKVALGPEPANEASGGRASRGALASPPATGARACPGAEVPKGAVIAPSETDFDSRRVGLGLHVFDVQSPRCGPITRRYLEYVPPSAKKTNPPLLILLHDTGSSAEHMRGDDTRWYFDALAEQEGFVLAYANAAPGVETNAHVANSGGWQTSERASPHVDDEGYLERIVADMKARAVIGSQSAVHLIGQLGGGSMALAAAAHRPDLYSGVAAFTPLLAVEPPRPVRLPKLTRALLVFQGDAAGTGGSGARVSAAEWAVMLGVPHGEGQHLSKRELLAKPHLVEQLDFATAASAGPAVRLLVLDRGSDPFPVPGAYSLAQGPGAPPPSGMRGAAEAWAFLSGAESAVAPVPDTEAAEEPVWFADELMLDTDVVGPLPR